MNDEYYWDWEKQFKLREIKISRKRSLLDYITKLEYYSDKIKFQINNGAIYYKAQRTLEIYYAVRNKLIEKSIKMEDF